MIDTTMTKQHARSLSTLQLQELVRIERKQIEAKMDEIKSLARKVVVMKHDLCEYEKELKKR